MPSWGTLGDVGAEMGSIGGVFVSKCPDFAQTVRNPAASPEDAAARCCYGRFLGVRLAAALIAALTAGGRPTCSVSGSATLPRALAMALMPW